LNEIIYLPCKFFIYFRNRSRSFHWRNDDSVSFAVQFQIYAVAVLNSQVI